MNKKKYFILAIESSCDDTSVAIINENKLLSLRTNTQINHRDYGGVVPELASRTHMEDIAKIVNEAIKEAEINKSQLSAIAITRGPGLMGSLIVGVSFAKGMAQSLGIPLIEVHHMHAHILAHHIEDPVPEFPYLCLTVSGGHTQIVKVSAYNKMEILGETLDDAAGEAFDKSGKMLGLDYPSGPVIDKLAQNGSHTYEFPIANVDDHNFSFSGLKTAIRRFLQKNIKRDENFITENMNDICCSIQETIIETLVLKLIDVSKEQNIQNIAIAGGVAANSGLRSRLESEAESRSWNLYIPRIKYCTDNAAMIAQAAKYKYEDEIFSDLSIAADPRMEF